MCFHEVMLQENSCTLSSCKSLLLEGQDRKHHNVLNFKWISFERVLYTYIIFKYTLSTNNQTQLPALVFLCLVMLGHNIICVFLFQFVFLERLYSLYFSHCYRPKHLNFFLQNIAALPLYLLIFYFTKVAIYHMT